MVVLEESSLGLIFSKKFLADLKMSSGLLECFVSVWFCLFCFLNILQKVLEHFLRSSSHLILAQIFAPFDYLLSSWCNFSCKFSIIGLNSRLKFSCKVLSIYLSQEILIFSCKVQFLEKYGACFLVQDFIYFNESFVEERLFFTFLC